MFPFFELREMSMLFPWIVKKDLLIFRETQSTPTPEPHVTVWGRT